MKRPEYPRPQWVRSDWLNLNGTWEYRTDRAVSGTDRKFYLTETDFSETVEVPFCRESKLSGIGDTDFCECVWYRKKLTVPQAWSNKTVLLHIGACDFATTLWVNEKEVGMHFGGMVSFSFGLTPYLCDGENVLTLRVVDDVRSGRQAGGKQSPRYGSYGCFYTRTTGIWQTVWLEAVETSYLTGAKYYPDIHANTLTVQAKAKNADGMTVTATAFYEGRAVGTASATVQWNVAMLTVPLSELHLWELGEGRLYDLELTMGTDTVKSYFGMRSIAMRDDVFYLNDKPVFQRLVLDQGYYPDGILTAPSEQALIRDIEYSMGLGFNGARLHQKIFEPLFLYHCDRLGYMVWGEHGNWGLDISAPEAWRTFMPEWLEAVERDFNHPAIIGWCPLNETQGNQDPAFVRFLASMTRAADPTRLYIEASGWQHVPGIADMVDAHDYDQDPVSFAAYYEPLKEGKPIVVNRVTKGRGEELGTTNFMSEYGGIHWDVEQWRERNIDRKQSWGYGKTPTSEEEFIARFKGLTEAMLFHPKMTALCYTQLTDVEQEKNGLYTFDRKPKFDPAIFRAILSQKAAIEE